MDSTNPENQPEKIAQWFVVQTMSGQENHAQASLLRRIELDKRENIDDGILEVVIPQKEVTERKNGKNITVKKKLYPGYMLVKCFLYLPDGNVDPAVWTIIKDTNGVIGFLGSKERPRRDSDEAIPRPVALPEEQVQQMLSQCSTTNEKPAPKVNYKVGETVIIREGAFENFEGTIDSIDNERQKLKLSVNVFGRSTPVEAEFWQVERP